MISTVEGRSGCGVIDSDHYYLENEAEPRYVGVLYTIHEDSDEGSTLEEVDTTVRIAGGHTDILKPTIRKRKNIDDH